MELYLEDIIILKLEEELQYREDTHFFQLSEVMEAIQDKEVMLQNIK